MKNFKEWKKSKDGTHAEVQRRTLMGIKLGIEHACGQIRKFSDPRSLVREESRNEAIKLTNSLIGPDQFVGKLKDILVAQYKSGRRDASEVIRNANALERASAELVAASSDYERTESMDHLNRAMINVRWSANGLTKLLDNYLT